MTDSNPSQPQDREVLALVHEGWHHLKLQRPLAAWASWQRALRRAPEDHAAREALEVLATAAELPLAARATYRFLTPADPARRERWDAGFRGRDLQDLPAAGEAFRRLTDADPADAPAWYNAALCAAWLGNNSEALAALERFVALSAETEPEAASEAWALG